MQALARSRKVDLNARRRNGDTALHLAAFSGHSKAVDTLLKLDRIDVAARNAKGFSAIDYAAARGHRGIVAALKRHLNLTADVGTK